MTGLNREASDKDGWRGMMREESRQCNVSSTQRARRKKDRMKMSHETERAAGIEKCKSLRAGG